MKWFTSITIQKIKERFSKSGIDPGAENLEKGRNLFLSNRISDALTHLNKAIHLGFETDAYELRGNCLQKLDCHDNAIEDFDKAIENDPLKFSVYYSRALSKKAVRDFTGHIEDIHNAIYYYKKSSTVENQTLKTFETQLLSAQLNIDHEMQNSAQPEKVPSGEIKSLIRDSLLLIKKVRLKAARS
ncbi:tetratricopeptide repeat protein [Flavobacterium sp. MDT1-60]|uniref:tetratricopeptide repeat protein n=1 Tax=Flavobacterium sp. MDT1-60 TaxID=1979344 RepID=UPI00177BAE2F|nr:tetratricopeptide repeat protein [Flavobacterium sp. MDT1-60]QOG01137.1 hypothetical protein IHE43_15090 [Flavobacterium sp. MDT1-60]